MSGRSLTRPDAAAWHDVECSGYAADLPAWRELAERRSGGAVLDLGCGTGRVALDLAARGHEVVGLDADAELVHALEDRARARGLPVRGVVADARSFDLPGRFALAIAPMQVVQLLGGPAGRTAMLGCVLAHLEPGGVLAVALADPFSSVPAREALPPLPDVLEIDGWVLSSIPVDVRDEGHAVSIHRQRQAVSPAGELTEETFTIRLDSVTPGGLSEEAVAVGLTATELLTVPPTRDYVGSSLVLLEAPR